MPSVEKNIENYNSRPANTTKKINSAGLEFDDVDVNGNAKVTQATTLDRVNDSITNYPIGCNMTVVDLATDADVVVTAAPALLLGVYVNVVMSAHDALIKDSTTTKLTLPASTAAGTKIDCHGGTFVINITVESNDLATGTLVIFWREI